MKIELVCRNRCARFAAPAETPEGDIVQRMTDEGPWYALGAGDCFQDMIRTALKRRGQIACPECGALVRVRVVEIDSADSFARG